MYTISSQNWRLLLCNRFFFNLIKYKVNTLNSIHLIVKFYYSCSPPLEHFLCKDCTFLHFLFFQDNPNLMYPWLVILGVTFIFSVIMLLITTIISFIQWGFQVASLIILVLITGILTCKYFFLFILRIVYFSVDSV